MVQLAKALGQPVHHSLTGVAEYPYTISFAIRKRLQYSSFYELPKEKQPPDDIWDSPEELEEWFDKVFDYGKGKPQTGLLININEVEG